MNIRNAQYSQIVYIQLQYKNTFILTAASTLRPKSHSVLTKTNYGVTLSSYRLYPKQKPTNIQCNMYLYAVQKYSSILYAGDANSRPRSNKYRDAETENLELPPARTQFGKCPALACRQTETVGTKIFWPTPLSTSSGRKGDEKMGKVT
jgi:hypothetical protein